MYGIMGKSLSILLLTFHSYETGVTVLAPPLRAVVMTKLNRVYKKIL